MKFRGTITPEIYRRAFSAQGSGLRFVAIVLIVAGVLNVFSAIRREEDPARAAILPAALITAGIMFLLLPRITARKLLSTNKMLQDEIQGEATAEHLLIQTAHGTSDLPWNMLHQSLVKPDIVLVYLSAYQYYVFPRSFFASDEEFREFQELVRRNVAPRKSKLLRVIILWVVIIILVFLLWSLFRTNASLP